MDTFQIIMLVVIAVVLTAMILLLFVGVKKNKVTTNVVATTKEVESVKTAEETPAVTQPVEETVVTEPVVETPVTEPDMETPVAETVENTSVTETAVEEAPVVPVEPAQEASVETATPTETFQENFIPTQNTPYKIGVNEVIKPGMYTLKSTTNNMLINLYGMDIPYGEETILALVEGDVLIAKSEIVMNRN